MERLRHLPQGWCKNFQQAVLNGDLDYTAQSAVTEYSFIEISHCEGHASGMKQSQNPQILAIAS
ncbi:MAG: hypothetical protein J7524_18530, partial [Roseofilum sp. Belize BBD 4]|uniref:hypothetical protein n=1 Tax=Roseofilum sp. Belize BBD 4 TaxID=2821500 RepID=UPI001B1BC9F8